MAGGQVLQLRRGADSATSRRQHAVSADDPLDSALSDVLAPAPARDPVHGAARSGVQGTGGPLPHLDAIQASFGHHDLAGVRAHTDDASREANEALGAEAYATGDQVAFRQAPSLHTAAHEAAHVVQQRAGVALKGGVGEQGDAYERHADAVADQVVRGGSAQSLLDGFSGGGGPGVQREVRRNTTVTRESRSAEIDTDKRPAVMEQDKEYGEVHWPAKGEGGGTDADVEGDAGGKGKKGKRPPATLNETSVERDAAGNPVIHLLSEVPAGGSDVTELNELMNVVRFAEGALPVKVDGKLYLRHMFVSALQDYFNQLAPLDADKGQEIARRQFRYYSVKTDGPGNWRVLKQKNAAYPFPGATCRIPFILENGKIRIHSEKIKITTEVEEDKGGGGKDKEQEYLPRWQWSGEMSGGGFNVQYLHFTVGGSPVKIRRWRPVTRSSPSGATYHWSRYSLENDNMLAYVKQWVADHKSDPKMVHKVEEFLGVIEDHELYRACKTHEDYLAHGDEHGPYFR